MSERSFELPQQLPLCPNPLFVIGSPRSGTSVFAWALYHSPDLTTFPETDFVYYFCQSGTPEAIYERIASRPEHRSWLIHFGVGREEFLGYAGAGLNALITSRASGKRWIDQTPTNTLVVETIALLFPGAFFLHVLRDGRRVVHSMMNFLSGKSEEFRTEFADLTWSTDFREACRTWARFSTLSIRFAAAHPERAMNVLNEELVSHPDDTFGRVLDFVGAARSEGPSTYLRTRRINSSFTEVPVGDPWTAWDDEKRQIFVDETSHVFENAPDELVESARTCWPGFDEWFPTTAAE